MSSDSLKSRRVSRRTSVTLVLTLSLVAAGLLAAGVAATAVNSLLPMARGQDSAYERSLSRDAVRLAVHVGAFDADGAAQPAAGALVTILSARQDAPLAVQTTDERGRVLFELRPGAYTGVVEYEGMTGSKDFVLRQDTRVGVVFDEQGQAHFFSHDRTDVARRGETHSLYVVVRESEGGEQHPVEGAHVVVARVTRDSDRQVDVQPAGRQATGPRGAAVFSLHEGQYAIEVRTPENLTARARVSLSSDQAVGVFFDENGTAHVRTVDAPRGERDAATHLGVRVVTENGRAVAGAHIVVYRVDREHPDGVAVARAAAGEEGQALFTLRPGQYRVEATHGDLHGASRVNLDGDQRVRIEIA